MANLTSNIIDAGILDLRAAVKRADVNRVFGSVKLAFSIIDGTPVKYTCEESDLIASRAEAAVDLVRVDDEILSLRTVLKELCVNGYYGNVDICLFIHGGVPKNCQRTRSRVHCGQAVKREAKDTRRGMYAN